MKIGASDEKRENAENTAFFGIKNLKIKRNGNKKTPGRLLTADEKRGNIICCTNMER